MDCGFCSPDDFGRNHLHYADGYLSDCIRGFLGLIAAYDRQHEADEDPIGEVAGS